MVSGFHSSKTALVARTMKSEYDGRPVLFNTMLLEGFIAMVWAGAAMAIMNSGLADSATSAISVVGIVALDMLGPVFGMLAIIGVIILPITSGDTGLRYLRMMIAEHFGIEQKSYFNRLKVSIPVFIAVAALLVWAKMSPGGFTILWRYFAWSNQTDAIFTFAIISIYFFAKGRRKAALIPLIPGAWYAFITFTYIVNARIGLNIPINIAYILGVVFALVYVVLIYRQGNKLRENNTMLENAPVYK
jgi:carbon starvation protein CstA